MPHNPDLKQDICRHVQAFATEPLRNAAVSFFLTLGYKSNRTLKSQSVSDFRGQFDPESRLAHPAALIEAWQSAEFLFQLTDEELSTSTALFKDESVRASLLQSYIFIAIELAEGDYARGKLAGIARQINRIFPMPVMVLFKIGGRISIAAINRRLNKRDEGKDVLGKVTLIQNISIEKPHPGHLDILASFSLAELTEGRRTIQNFDQLHAAWEEVFNVELLNKRFYRELANWYFWALPQVDFPADIEKDTEKRRATGLIRLLTRLIFCWFLKEKGLVPDDLFVESELRKILKDLSPDASTYNEAILQNLFFATLNQRMGKDAKGQPYRTFAKDEGFQKNRTTYGVDTLYRYEDHFRDPNTALEHFADVPFLNGGLFECLDRTEEGTGKKLYLDGFSRNRKKRATIPNYLFFGSEHEEDLSAAYGDRKRKKEKVRGLLHILNAYKFTIVENTPIDQEIALDPELLGKVFENLLASYNEETKTTARKQTGSFYTPRSIVEYMVDESLKAHLTGVLTATGMSEQDAKAGLDILFAYTERPHPFNEKEAGTLLDGIHHCKILDPACGSGAFPMGMLHKLVHIIHKLDPNNERWKQLQIDAASAIPDVSARDAAIEAIERDFADNDDDYGRKLYLIENCLYGVDIQPIAIQISKLRFFISLVADQRTNRNKRDNHGIRPLPNLETKFVAADALTALKLKQSELFTSPNVKALESELQRVRHDHFAATTRQRKLILQKRDRELREALARELEQGTFGDGESNRKLSAWNPYDPQQSAEFFEPLWMFDQSLGRGFDVVIGNPPYLNVELVERERKAYFASHYETFYKRYDIFGLFFEAALTRQTNAKGVVTFIIPQQIANNLSYRKLRNLILENCWLSEVFYLGDKVFQAANNDVCVLFLNKVGNNSIRLVNALDLDNQVTTIVPADHFKRYGNIISFSGDANGEAIFEKVFSGDRWLLKERFAVFQGIVTGNNAAFLPTPEQVREANIESVLLHPVLLGRDFEKWSIRSTERRILYTDANTDISQFPNAKKWLEQFRDELETRRECRNGVIPWFSLQWPRNQSDLDRAPKILIQRTRNPRLKTRIVATVDEQGLYGMESIIFIVPQGPASSAFFLLAVLNSSLINFLYATRYLNVAVKAEYLKSTPIPIVSKKVESSLSCLAKCVLTAKQIAQEAAAKFLEDLIDACVMECYFHEHMAQRNLLFLDDLATHLASFDDDRTESPKREFIEQLYSTLNAPTSKMRNRLLRISADSPDLLAVINSEGKA